MDGCRAWLHHPHPTNHSTVTVWDEGARTHRGEEKRERLIGWLAAKRRGGGGGGETDPSRGDYLPFGFVHPLAAHHLYGLAVCSRGAKEPRSTRALTSCLCVWICF